MKFKVCAPCTVLDTRCGDAPVLDPARLATLDGVASEECFSDYLSDAPSTKHLPNRGVSGGVLSFQFRADTGTLWAETVYDLRQPLSTDDYVALAEYTTGQWSDGIGENFCPEYADQTGLFLGIHWEAPVIALA